ncbi:MAG: phosphoglucosamine mutase [Candidatus Aminicenantes bacterium]|nr:phosphoglucosamine mutase [Candidatus Aminicenantes bacterium]
MGKLFGTDGVRGKANIHPMTAETALKIGQAVAHILKKDGHRLRVVIGKDTRLSCYMFESALASGLMSMGADVVLVGPLPTPGIAFITSNMDADAGIVISASHNPYEDNGIKIFGPGGFKLSDEQEREVERLVLSGELIKLTVDSRNIGRAAREDDALGRYIVFLRHTFPRDLSLEGLKIVVDCANGATYKIAPLLFREMRAEVVPLHIYPNGTNINRDSGAVSPASLSAAVKEHGAHIGLAFDGDGDRLIAADEKGRIVSGDKILAICAKNLKDEGRLANDLVVHTVMSNLGLSLALEDMGMDGIVTKVGDRNVLEAMVRRQAVIGGEDSGHLIFMEHHTTGDGILSALQLLAVMRKTGKPLSELSRIFTSLPQVVINVGVKTKPSFKTIPEIQEAISCAEEELGEKGRVLVRYSGTQTLCRVMVEGPTEKVTRLHAERIAAVITRKLG